MTMIRVSAVANRDIGTENVHKMHLVEDGGVDWPDEEGVATHIPIDVRRRGRRLHVRGRRQPC